MSIFDIGISILDKLIPDPQAKAQAQLELLKLQQSGDLADLNAQLQTNTNQSDINKVEAANEHIFVSGWRPFIGWVCGAGLAYQFVFGPLATWVAALLNRPVAMPQLDLSTLLTLLFGMLGLGGMRTIEKLKGTK